MSAIRLTREALLCLEAVGLDIEETVRRDMRALRDERVSAAELLAHCQHEADASRERGWREYVATIARARALTRMSRRKLRADILSALRAGVEAAS